MSESWSINDRFPLTSQQLPFIVAMQPLESLSEAMLVGAGELARREFGELTATFPEQGLRGGTLLLGKHYALERGGVLMLGINPGGSVGEFYTGRYDSNCLVDEGGTNIRYWRNARAIFASTPVLATAMSKATFAFCCPFRSVNWNGQPRALREALVSHSRAILERLMNDCVPRIVIVAGVAGEALFRQLLEPGLEVESALPGGGDNHGTYQWRAHSASLNGHQFTLAQIPHLSRANSKARLHECGAWLGSLVNSANPLHDTAADASS